MTSTTANLCLDGVPVLGQRVDRVVRKVKLSLCEPHTHNEFHQPAAAESEPEKGWVGEICPLPVFPPLQVNRSARLACNLIRRSESPCGFGYWLIALLVDLQDPLKLLELIRGFTK